MYRKMFFVVFLFACVVGVFHNKKPLPDLVSYESPVYQVSQDDMDFFQDVTFVNDARERFSEQEIFDEILAMIEGAEEYILIDLFFYSNFIGVEASSYRQLAAELTKKLLDKKAHNPDITIQVITDPINVMYGGHTSADFERLRMAGIPVTITDVRPLRDSNPLYSAVWRTALQWLGNSAREGWLPNPLDAQSPKLGLRTYFTMLNYKANHRKVVLADYRAGDRVGLATLITSANPHDGSSAHSNIAVRVDSHIWQDILKTESVVVDFSGGAFIEPSESLLAQIVDAHTGSATVQLITEGKIEHRVLAEIANTDTGDQIDIAMFYFADRDVVRALKAADARGVMIRLLLDPNKDAFGREKNGTPNRQIAHELMKHSSGNTTVRWCDTHGEQCHSKLLLVTRGDQVVMMQGSANYTKRNLQDYNLETNLVITGSVQEPILVEIATFFETQWGNEAERFYSTAYETYEDTRSRQMWVYRFKEFTGLSRW